MIKVPYPHMVLNAPDFPGSCRVRMWNTYDVPDDHDVEHILGWTANVGRAAPGGRLETLVIACHGFVDNDDRGGFGLKLGKGVYRKDTSHFAKLKGLVNNIWIFACQAAAITVPTGPGSTTDGDGNLFCCEVAKQSGSNVTASQANNYGVMFGSGIGGGLGYGYIPDWSGTVVTYGPGGNVVATKKYW